MALTGILLDDGTGGFPSNCFPVRSLRGQSEEDGGAWLVAHKITEKKRFKAVLCAKPRNFNQIRAERKKAEKEGTNIVPPPTVEPEEDEPDDGKVLDGFFLMKHCCVEDPVDLCSINISGEKFSDVKAEDFQLFDNVAYVNASENFLSVDAFRHFPIIRELEMPLNGLRNLKLNLGDYPNLEMLDLSYNNLAPDDLLVLGLLPSLRVLHLTGNGLHALPAEMSRPCQPDGMDKKLARFSRLEVLLLDDNHLENLATFATLAGLLKLQHLSLSKNNIYSVPHLMLNEGMQFTNDDTRTPSPAKSKHSGRLSSRKEKKLSRERQQAAIHKQYSRDIQKSLKPPKDDASAPSTDPGAPPVTERTQTPEITEESENVDDMKLEELDLGDLDKKVQDDIRREHALDNDVYAGAYVSSQNGDAGMPPPFPELRHLDLSHNMISEEDGLLPLAAWPMLCELLIHNNPLTTQTSGDPPLLKRFLQERLGINITRKTPSSPSKPHIEVPQRPNRKVKTKVPSFPRCNVDELLALEAPPKTSIPPVKVAFDPSQPLPPIPGTPKSPDNHDNTQQSNKDQFSGEAFFMTQVDEQDADRKEKVMSPKEDRPRRKKKMKKRNVPSKYKGYEDILDIDMDQVNDEDVPMPKDIQGNIRALKYTLNHPLVFRDNKVDLEAPQDPFRPYIRRKETVGQPVSTQQEKVSKVLDDVKNGVSIVEEPLEDVLNKCQADRRGTYYEAKRLLAEVQTRYNTVRENSMTDGREVRHMVAEAMRQVDKVNQKKLQPAQ